ncbi:MAG TPA: response regulator [Luteibacter sp.]|jgi:DNA-binding response OmpR family regulator|nr:response regulator [Luteibacter sp.]
MNTPAAGPQVLVVEDELMIAATLEMALESKGYRVLGPVATIDEAIGLLETVRPDLALIDYRLARTTTEALLPVLDAHRVPVCVLTGYGRAQLPVTYAGYTVLEKPFSMKDLLATIAGLVPAL